MKLVVPVKLLADDSQKALLLATMERVNDACCWLAHRIDGVRVADKMQLHKPYYRELRQRFGLSAQHAVRTIAKVCGAYKQHKDHKLKFKSRGGISLDRQLYTFSATNERVSIRALDGRIVIPCAVAEYHAARLKGRRGQADLVLRGGFFYLLVTVDVDSASFVSPNEWIGVDLGVLNIAVDSDGDIYACTKLNVVRLRMRRLRAALQRAGTKSAKRHLRKISRRESGFRADVNHVISKALVAKAKDTGRGLALEDLRGIRDRVTVRKAQRAAHDTWAFFQARRFISYKCGLSGVALTLVDPRNTSRTCPECGHCDKANRISQSEFICKSCGHTEHADVVGARNIARRAAVNRPIVPSVDAGTRDLHRIPRGAQEQAA